jgi:hypothetical protein
MRTCFSVCTVRQRGPSGGGGGRIGRLPSLPGAARIGSGTSDGSTAVGGLHSSKRKSSRVIEVQRPMDIQGVTKATHK